MAIESVTLKSGVLFVETPSGGTLMDVRADRFIALTRVSSAIWSGLAAGQGVSDLIATISATKGIRDYEAKALLSRQLDRWERVELINVREEAGLLPLPKVAPIKVPAEVSHSRMEQEPLVLWLGAQLLVAERRYRRAVRRLGLARALVVLQTERRRSVKPPEKVLLRTIRNYYAFRRAFRQGRTADDCLFRSLALAAVLRRQGIQADLCIGVVDIPFSSHAWVEACDLVLNETLNKRSQYVVIGRF